MSRVFYIADLHLGHENMAIKRGFKNSEEHDNHIIERWNTVIHNRDTVWILGDLTMESPSHYYMLDKLKGIKNAVLGNHDLPQYIPELQKHVNKICGMIRHKGMFLTHCPIHPMELEHRVPINMHGHCVDDLTQILTFDGWKSYNEIKQNDLIYSLNPNTLEIEKDYISKVIINECYEGKMYQIKSKGLDMMVTDEHRIPYLDKNNSYKVDMANEFINKINPKIFKSFQFNNNGIELSDDLLRLYICIAADGSYTEYGLCRFGIKKDRKIALFEEILNKLNVPYTKSKSKHLTHINFHQPIELDCWKVKGLDNRLLNCNRKQVEIIKNIYSKTDGNRNLIFTSNKEEVDLLQHLFVINGFQCKVHSRFNHGFSKGETFQLSVTDKKTQMISYLKNKVKSIENYNGLVWCVKSNNQNFIARRNGSVFLTGNCHENNVMIKDVQTGEMLKDNRYICVSCEQVDYTPRLLNELI